MCSHEYSPVSWSNVNGYQNNRVTEARTIIGFEVTSMESW